MREILFRGKRLDNGEWIMGGIVPSLNSKDFYIGNMFEANKVDPGTIGQYTGLQGKNGKKIFEGDIVQTTYRSGERVKHYRFVIKYGGYTPLYYCREMYRQRQIIGFYALGVKRLRSTPWLY